MKVVVCGRGTVPKAMEGYVAHQLHNPIALEIVLQRLRKNGANDDIVILFFDPLKAKSILGASAVIDPPATVVLVTSSGMQQLREVSQIVYTDYQPKKRAH